MPRWIIPLALTVVLASCGGGGGGDASTAAADPAPTQTTAAAPASTQSAVEPTRVQSLIPPTPAGQTPAIARSTAAKTASTRLTKAAPDAPSYVAPFGRDASQYSTLTFRDEFDGDRVDPGKWTPKLWYMPDNPLPNHAVFDGKLSMWAVKSDDGSWRREQREFTTDSTFWQKYGYWEARMKAPVGQGLWPAFWLLSYEEGDARPELDVFEAYSSGSTVDGGWANDAKEPVNYGASMHQPSAGYWNGPIKLGQIIPGGVNLASDFHVYGMHWDASGVQFYFDGKPLGDKVTDAPVAQRMFTIIGLGLGSASGDPDDSTPQSSLARPFEVDYVRVWALSDGSSEVSGDAIDR